MLPKPALLSSIEVPEPALSLSSASLALLRVLAVSMYFIGTIPDNGTTQPALYRPPHCTYSCSADHDRDWPPCKVIIVYSVWQSIHRI